MPKNLAVIVAIVVILVLGGAAVFFYQNQYKPTNNNAITSIKDVLTKPVGMICNFTDESGRQTKSYIKNGLIRSDVTAEDPRQSGSIIVNNKKMYFWTSEGGFMMDIAEAAVAPSETNTSGQGLSKKEQLVADLEKYKDNCKNASVSDSLFIPPADVDFQDLSQMIPQAPTGVSQ